MYCLLNAKKRWYYSLFLKSYNPTRTNTSSDNGFRYDYAFLSSPL